MEERLVSVSEETTTGVKQMQESGTLLFHAINVTKSKVALICTSCCCCCRWTRKPSWLLLH